MGLGRRGRWSPRALFADRRGATAVEYTLVFPLYFMMLVGIIELALWQVSSAVLDSATEQAGRLLRTGEVANAGGSQRSAFETALCSSLFVVIGCTEVQYDVRTFDDLSTITYPTPPEDADGDGAYDGLSYEETRPCSYVIVRTFYRHDFLLPLVPALMTLGSAQYGGSDYLTAAVVFTAEPYDTDDLAICRGS